jgi:hypothetical protein
MRIAFKKTRHRYEAARLRLLEGSIFIDPRFNPRDDRAIQQAFLSGQQKDAEAVGHFRRSAPEVGQK